MALKKDLSKKQGFQGIYLSHQIPEALDERKKEKDEAKQKEEIEAKKKADEKAVEAAE